MRMKIFTLPSSLFVLVSCSFPPEFKGVEGIHAITVIERGSAFNISIGDTRRMAHKILVECYSQFKFVDSACLQRSYNDLRDASTYRQEYVSFDCQGRELRDVYHDALGPGMSVSNIEIVSRNGLVTQKFSGKGSTRILANPFYRPSALGAGSFPLRVEHRRQGVAGKPTFGARPRMPRCHSRANGRYWRRAVLTATSADRPVSDVPVGLRRVEAGSCPLRVKV